MLGFFALLLLCQLVGEVIVAIAGLPLPGPVVGMAILFCGLVGRGGIPAGLAATADALLAHLSLLFVPAGVGVMLHADLISAELLAIGASLIVSTLLTIVVTAGLVCLLRGQGVDR